MSYGIYLWHYPLMELAHDLGEDRSLILVIIGFVITPAVAAVSYYGLERPVRTRVRRRLGRTGAPVGVSQPEPTLSGATHESCGHQLPRSIPWTHYIAPVRCEPPAEFMTSSMRCTTEAQEWSLATVSASLATAR